MKKGTQGIIFAATLAVIMGYGITAYAQKSASSAKKTDNSAKTEAVYKSLPVDDSLKSQPITQLLNGGLDDAAKTSIKNYFTKYFFARWTVEANADQLKKFRQELDDLLRGTNGEGKNYALKASEFYLRQIYDSPNFFPACRYNAILSLGSLNNSDSLNALVSAYTPKDDAEKAKRLADPAYEAIRVGALLGIMRHVQSGIADENLRDGKIVPLLIDIASDTPHKEQEGNVDETDNSITVTTETSAIGTKEPQRTIEQHDWFRERAIQMLGNLKASKEQAKIVETLLSLMKDKNEKPEIRYEAAFALSQLDIAASGVAIDKVTDALLTLSVNVCDDGIQFMISEMASQQFAGSTGGTSGGTMGGMSGGMGMDSGGYGGSMSGGTGVTSQAQADQINNSISQIKYGFSSVLACVAGPDYKKGGLMTADAVKNTPSLEVLVNLNKVINESITFLEKGDPDAEKRKKEMSSLNTMSSESGMSSMGGTGTATVSIKNQPKVTMREIDDQLKTLKNELDLLQKTLNNPVPAATANAGK